MELSKVYKALLTLAGIEVDDQDRIYTKIKGEHHHIRHGGKDIYIPSKKAANTAALNNGLIFNPLNENVLVKKDPVFSKIADKIVADLNSIIGTWMYTLSKLMEQNVESVTTMKPSVLSVIKEVGEVPKDFSSRMMMFAAACAEPNQNHRYLNYKITGNAKDKSYNKRCAVWSGYKKTMDKLYTGEWSSKQDDDKRVAGAVLRKSDGKPFEKMLFQILPGLAGDAYTKDSLSQISPTVDSFLKSIQALLKDMSSFHDKVSSIEDFEWPDYDLSWVKFMENVDKHTTAILNMPNDCANVPVANEAVHSSSPSPAELALAKANEKLLRDSQPAQNNNVPPWEDIPAKHVPTNTSSGTKALTVQDILSGKHTPEPGQVSAAMRETLTNNARSGPPTVASILGNSQPQSAYRAAPVQTLFSGSLTHSKYSPSQIATVPSMSNMGGMRIPGMGF